MNILHKDWLSCFIEEYLIKHYELKYTDIELKENEETVSLHLIDKLIPVLKENEVHYKTYDVLYININDIKDIEDKQEFFKYLISNLENNEIFSNYLGRINYEFIRYDSKTSNGST